MEPQRYTHTHTHTHTHRETEWRTAELVWYEWKEVVSYEDAVELNLQKN